MSSDNWFVECGANLPKGFFTRNHMTTPEGIIDFRYRYNNRGVFATAYMYDSEDQSQANLYGDFYLDFDYEIGDSEDKEKAFDIVRQEALGAARYFKAIYGIPYETLRIYFSGSKGLHLIIAKELLGVEPNKHLNLIYRMMAEDTAKLSNAKTLDMKIYDNKRLFRLVNSVHPKTDLYKIPISHKELTSLSFKEITELAKRPRSENKPTLSKISQACMEFNNYYTKLAAKMNKPKGQMKDMVLDYTPPCIEYLLNNPVGKGQRNDTLAFLASFLKQTGISEERAEEKLLDWNDQMCDPSVPEREVGVTVQSMYKSNGKVGCAKAKILSRCDPDKCKFKKGM